jgi:glycosyltransferase involved in cell wall biosynthesis
MNIGFDYKPYKSPRGGANAFLKALIGELRKRGLRFTTDSKKADLIFLNSLTNRQSMDSLRAKLVEQYSKYGIPIVHRKTGFWGRGAAEYHTPDKNGIIRGDALQLEFSSSISHHIFQSHYSHNSFVKSGFNSQNYSIIHNGADTRFFNFELSTLTKNKSKDIWNPSKILRLVISSWSNNYNKGFHKYAKLDKLLVQLKGVKVHFIGRLPQELKFTNITVHKPVNQRKLAEFLKHNHVILQCSQNDTCSNSLIEGLCCGLPAIYLASGANGELAGEYGVPYSGDWNRDIDSIKSKYHIFVERLRSLPYSIEKAGDRYLEVFQKVIES